MGSNRKSGKGRGGVTLAAVSLDPRAEEPLYRQLYEHLRDLILGGRLAPGDRLPSSRTLAGELELSRNTVTNAFDQLVAEGYLERRVGDGTYVASNLPAEGLEAAARGRRAAAASGGPGPSARARRILELAPGRDATRPRPFAVGVPAVDRFPMGMWNRLVSRVARATGPADLCAAEPAGYEPLRQAVASYLATARGVECDVDQVIIASSSQQGLDLASRVLLDPGDLAALEDPGYLGARGALVAAGARLAPIPVDEAGLVVERLDELDPPPRLVYVTPSHQYPTGATLDLERRLALLDWARAAGAWVVEDDYDSEFRYRGRPLASLQGLGGGAHVLYVGTFTKVLFPSLRVAYLVAPRELVPALLAARNQVDRHNALFAQRLLAEFLASGRFASHLRKMRQLYRARQQKLMQELAFRAGGRLVPRPDDAGMHLVVDLLPGTDERRLAAAARARGVEVSPLSTYRLGAAHETERPAVLLGYACVPRTEMADAVGRLLAALDEVD